MDANKIYCNQIMKNMYFRVCVRIYFFSCVTLISVIFYNLTLAKDFHIQTPRETDCDFEIQGVGATTHDADAMGVFATCGRSMKLGETRERLASLAEVFVLKTRQHATEVFFFLTSVQSLRLGSSLFFVLLCCVALQAGKPSSLCTKKRFYGFI